jgi:AraC-like DNA-binding protein
LNLSQVESGALEVYPEQVDVSALLSEVFCAMADGNAQSNVEWRLQLPDTLPPLYADPVRLRQVLLNLLSNAARFTAEGHITLGAHHAKDELHIWVEDTGAGIGLSDHNQTVSSTVSADAFANAVRAQHGAGLGLHVAQHLVSLHGGTLSAHSRHGHGTLFQVWLPLHAAIHSVQVAPIPNNSAGPESSELVLHTCLQRATSLSRSLAAYVAEHYAAPLSREEISTALKVSPNHLSRVFRRDTGMTPWQYLSQYRVIQAQKLLLASELSVTEVAQRVGFNDPAYFVRVFHKETGRAPLQYRKSAK